MLKSRLHFASKIAGWHLFISFLLACLIATLVFFVWYPYPLREVTGSFGLFWLLIGVDVVCGPLMTFILASPKKSRRDTIVDLSLIAIIQLSAMVYGMYHVFEARPVVVVFEVDRLRVLSPVDIAINELPQAPKAYQKLPLFSRLLLSTRKAHDSNDRLDSIEKALAGLDIGQRPSWWIPYADSLEKIQQQAQPVVALQKNVSLQKQKKAALDKAIKRSGVSADKLAYLPLVSARTAEWIALLDTEMSLVGAAPIDGFLANKNKQK